MFKDIKIKDLVESPTNPRTMFDTTTLTELSNSIKSKGVLQPIIVRKDPNDEKKFEIVAGSRRFRASQEAGLKTIPATIRELTDEEVMEIQIVENSQRENPNPIDEASAFKFYMDKYRMSAQEIADKIGKSKDFVHRRIVLNQLIEEGKKLVYEGVIPITSGMKIATLSDEQQKKTIKWGLTEHKNEEGEEVKYFQDTRTLSNFISNTLMTSLANVPWDLNSEMYPPVACVNCPKRTGANKSLFPEISGDDKCLDTKCFAKKRELWWEMERAKHAEEHSLNPEDIVLVKGEYDYTLTGKDIIDCYNVEEIPEEDKCNDCKPAMYITGGDRGKFFWMACEKCKNKIMNNRRSVSGMTPRDPEKYSVLGDWIRDMQEEERKEKEKIEIKELFAKHAIMKVTPELIKEKGSTPLLLIIVRNLWLDDHVSASNETRNEIIQDLGWVIPAKEDREEITTLDGWQHEAEFLKYNLSDIDDNQANVIISKLALSVLQNDLYTDDEEEFNFVQHALEYYGLNDDKELLDSCKRVVKAWMKPSTEFKMKDLKKKDLDLLDKNDLENLGEYLELKSFSIDDVKAKFK